MDGESADFFLRAVQMAICFFGGECLVSFGRWSEFHGKFIMGLYNNCQHEKKMIGIFHQNGR